ncbi:MAG: AEC family transporter [Oscillospiraceae bacterium]|nr:AEC family transporter [Oscillospiraceae bacterium]
MFTIVFSNIITLFLYALLGFLLCKGNKVKITHARSFSGLLLFALSPAMILNSFLQLECTAENSARILKYFLATLLIQLLFFALLYLAFRKKYADARYRILCAGGVLGNVGFFGMPVISSLFPDEPIVLCYSSINVMSMNLIVFTLGVYLITNDRKYISAKSALMNPTTLSILSSLPVFFLSIHFPAPLESAIGIMAKMVTPISMMILGMRLSAVSVKKIFTRLPAYTTAFFKLIAFPVFAFFCVRWIPFFDNTLKATVVVLAAMPSGAVIETLAELHECEQEFSANVVLLTTMLSLFTIPLIAAVLL